MRRLATSVGLVSLVSYRSAATSRFHQAKEKIVADLAANRNDKSLVGRVDPLILPLVEELNAMPQYCTLSSCSGRVSVFHRASGSISASNSNNNSNSNSKATEEDASVSSSSNGGDGEGASSSKENITTTTETTTTTKVPKKRGSGLGTIYSTHDPIENVSTTTREVMTKLEQAGIPLYTEIPSSHELVQVKFEPTIIHVMCETWHDAHKLLAAASASGHKQAGIGISPVDQHHHRNHHHHNSKKNTSSCKGSTEKQTDDSNTATELNTTVSTPIDLHCDASALWKITFKMTSMLSFDAPLYSSDMGGWLLPVAEMRTLPIGKLDDRSSHQLCAMIEQLLQLGSGMFEENITRRQRFFEEVRKLKK